MEDEYLDKYIDLMSMAQTRKELEGAVEYHHPFPNSWMKNKYVVALSLEEHLVAHYWLHKAFPEDRGMSYALGMMSSRVRVEDSNLEEMSKLYSEARESLSKTASEHMMTDAHPWRGKKRPNHSETMKGNSHLRGHKHSETTKAEMSESRRGERNGMHGRTGEESPMYGKPNPGVAEKWKRTCEHCGKTMQKSLFKRWHGENCKLIKKKQE